MAQSITTFRENGKIYIIIDNPTSETEKAVSEIFAQTAIDLAGIFKPAEAPNTKEEAKKIEDKKPTAPAEEAEELPFDEEPIKPAFGPETMNPPEPVAEPEKPAKKPVEQFTPDEAKEYLTRFLKALEKTPNMKYKPADILVALFILRNRLDGVEQVKKMGPEKAAQLWIEKKKLKDVIRSTGYDWKGNFAESNDGWV